MASKEYIIGADIGTTGCKTIILDNNGNLIDSKVEYYQTNHPKHGWAEQNPEDWYNAFRKTLKYLIRKNKIKKEKIVGIGLDGMMNSPVFLDKFGKVLRPCILWMDQRSAQQALFIKDKFLIEKIDILNPLLLSPIFLLTKIAWVKEKQQKIWKKTYKIILPKDYVRFKLTGILATDISDASATGLFDIKKLDWSTKICEILDINLDKFPNILPSTKIAGYVSEKASKEVGIPKDIPIVTGCSDGAADCLTAGVVNHADCLVRLGTTGAIFVAAEKCIMDTSINFFILAHCIQNRWLMHHIFPFGIPHKWFYYTFYEKEMKDALKKGKNFYSIIEEKIKKIPPGSEGLIFHPYIASSDEYLKGSFFGITSYHKKEHFARSILEGIAFSLKEKFIPFLKLIPSINEIRFIGGGSKSKLTVQIICNTLNVKGLIPSFQDASLGAAMIGGIGSGVFKDYTEAIKKCVKIKDTITPSLDIQKRYDKLFTIFLKLRQSIVESYKLLNKN
ncbi:MAG: FGGY family carbohydrate kinase [Candidatus Methanomethylicaceae archaeon]